MKKTVIITICGLVLIAGAVYARKRVAASPIVRLSEALKHPEVVKLDTEVKRLQANVNAHPNDASARWALADIYQKIGLLDNAGEQLEAIVKLTPESYDAGVALADCRLALKQYEKAQTAFRVVTEKWPKRAYGYQGLATVYYQRGFYTNALSTIQKAIDLEPNNLDHKFTHASSLLQWVQHFPNGDNYILPLNEARKELEELLPKWPAPGEIELRLGSCYYMLRDFKGAIKHYSKAIELVPDRVDLVVELAQSHMDMGDRQGALKVVEDAIAKGAQYGPLFDLQGQLIQATGTPDSAPRALKAFEQAAKLMPESAPYWDRYGGTLARAGRLEDAAVAFSKSVLINPERSYPFQQLAAVYSKLAVKVGDKDPAKQKDLYERASKSAQLASQKTHNEQQLRQAELISQQHPEQIGPHLVLADRYKDLKLYVASREQYLMVLRIDHKNQRAVDGVKSLEKMLTSEATN